MKRQLLTSALAAATCSFLVVALAPPAGALGGTAGFVDTGRGWKVFVPDPPAVTADDACTVDLQTDNGRPEFTNLVISGTTVTMTETAYASAVVHQWDCGSRAVIGAFRMTDYPLYYSDERYQSTRWQYGYGADSVGALLQQQISRDIGLDDVLTGTVNVEAGAWWGKPDPKTGRMVYYPAGCLQQTWAYTVAAWSNTVEAQMVGDKLPCPQPPLPGTPELL